MKVCVLRQIQQSHSLSSPSLCGLGHSPMLDLMSPVHKLWHRQVPVPVGAVPLCAPVAELLNRSQDGKASFLQNPTQQHRVTVKTE